MLKMVHIVIFSVKAETMSLNKILALPAVQCCYEQNPTSFAFFLPVAHKLLCTQLVTLVLLFFYSYISLLSHLLAVCDLLIQQHTPTCPSKPPNRWCSNDLPFPTPSSSPGPRLTHIDKHICMFVD